MWITDSFVEIGWLEFKFKFIRFDIAPPPTLVSEALYIWYNT